LRGLNLLIKRASKANACFSLENTALILDVPLNLLAET